MIKWLPIILVTLLPFLAHGQDVGALIREAERFRLQLNDERALEKYLEVIRLEPAHLRALCAASELYNIVGKRLPEKTQQKDHFRKGRDLAVRALRVDSTSSEAHFAMAVSMGRMALISSGEEKINAVRDIKTHADKCIRFDRNNYKGYHVLARWHYEISRLSSFERWMVKMAYGALPKASLETAAANYETSMRLNEGFLLNYLELAKVYKEQKQASKAKAMLQKLESLPQKTADDAKIKSEGRQLLRDL